MIKKVSTTRFAVLATGTFVASLALGALMVTAINTPQPITHIENHASWTSSADTVAQQTLEADLIVRVQALERGQSRHLWSPRPAGAELAQSGSSFVFTDTRFEVLEVYQGNARVGDDLLVMQTGGDIIDSRGEGSRIQLSEDPLYGLGSEQVLFLVDISGDSVHARGGELYRTVNPAGRYELNGNLVDSSEHFGNKAQRPSVLSSLEEEIQTAVRERAKLEAL